MARLATEAGDLGLGIERTSAADWGIGPGCVGFMEVLARREQATHEQSGLIVIQIDDNGLCLVKQSSRSLCTLNPKPPSETIATATDLRL